MFPSISVMIDLVDIAVVVLFGFLFPGVVVVHPSSSVFLVVLVVLVVLVIFLFIFVSKSFFFGISL
jgi:hypothetical protein